MKYKLLNLIASINRKSLSQIVNHYVQVNALHRLVSVVKIQRTQNKYTFNLTLSRISAISDRLQNHQLLFRCETDESSLERKYY